MPQTMNYSGTLTVTSCWCGVHVAIPSDLYRQARENGKQVYCPLGHIFVWQKTRKDELEEELLAERREVARQRALRDQAEADARYQQHRANGYKGVAAKTKKRAAKGICPSPSCKRSFVNVAKHVATCHPEMVTGEAEPAGAHDAPRDVEAPKDTL